MDQTNIYFVNKDIRSLAAASIQSISILSIQLSTNRSMEQWNFTGFLSKRFLQIIFCWPIKLLFKKSADFFIVQQ